MLRSVVDECISMALASASRRMSQTGGRNLRRPEYQRSLAAYPRLAAALQRAEADGVLSRSRSVRAFH